MIALAQERLLTTEEAAKLLRLRPGTLTRMRAEGRGPAYFRAGRMPRYRLADLEGWLESRRVETSTEA